MDIHLPTITDPQLLAEIEKHAHIMEFEAGQAIIEPGQYIKMVPVVLEGTIKVLRTNDEGHELFLYYIEGGETCAVSLTCCSIMNPSDIKAVAEEKTKILAVPARKHEEWSHEFRQWKDFVSLTYQKRFQSMFQAIDDLAFKKMDQRLLKYLAVKAKQTRTNELNMTHQEIASELGTSREVVSRLLKQLENRKLVELGRNVVYVRDGLEEFIDKN
ncbi:Crp/Fnr family transcriptional regulator [Cesiribacter andamanensis]|uniref:cAMP regulatory protein n=1 Tax=Cesiribacter andamanensis AMV16 TaxID=1279009 RepID=M7N154_9BACT|nr:Crp/Fnr family transcriptional regulator [Cesiribacter andamanensis]EMR01032.1 cAMP regulatory protein [Cesiribacter andamanensis AMV16]